MTVPSRERPLRLGIVVHPARDVSGPLTRLTDWSVRAGAEVVQVPVPVMTRRLAPEAPAETCDLIVSIGGDGTMLAAARVGMTNARPVLGIACGSLGVLARVAPAGLAAALDHFAAGEWAAEPLPGLEVLRAGQTPLVALNDVSVMRAGIGQIRVAIEVDGMLYGRVAGDGVVVATALGSSAYSLAAGGPVLHPGVAGFVITPLPTHGGQVPPPVLGPASRAVLQVAGGFGGARLELDGQIVTGAPERLEAMLRPDVARLVALPGQAPLLAVLRDRRVIRDSPRILAEGHRMT
jgi:NAD+ kinase